MLIISQDKKYLVTLENGIIYNEGATIVYRMEDGSLYQLGEYSINGKPEKIKVQKVMQNIFTAQEFGQKTFSMP